MSKTAKISIPDEPEMTQEAPKGEEMVQVSKVDLQTLLARVSQLEKESKEPQGNMILEEITERKAIMRKFQNKWVVDFKNQGTSEKPNYVKLEPVINPVTGVKEFVEHLDVFLLGEKEPITMELREYLRMTEREEVKIASRKDVPWLIKDGLVEVVNTTNTDIPKGSGVMKQMVAKGFYSIYTVILDGKEIEVRDYVLG